MLDNRISLSTGSPLWSCFILLCSPLWFPGVFSIAVDSELENHGCGGIFRHRVGSLNFTFNDLTFPNKTDVNKICLWQVLPEPLLLGSRFRLSITRFDLIPENDKLSLTTFAPHGHQFTAAFRASEVEESKEMKGVFLVVTLISHRPVMGSGFRLTWDNTAATTITTPEPKRRWPVYRKPVSAMNNSTPVPTKQWQLHEAYNSYGRLSSTGTVTLDLPGYTFSTLAITKGNHTEGLTLRIRFPEIKFNNGFHACPSRFTCPALLVARIQDDGYVWGEFSVGALLGWIRGRSETVISKFGVFLVVWGGEFYNSSYSGEARVSVDWETVEDIPAPPNPLYFGSTFPGWIPPENMPGIQVSHNVREY